MTHRSELGKFGEDLACEYLVKKGYKIIDRNFRKPWGELDIITRAPDKTLVFVEVKTVRQNLWQAPEKQLSPELFRKPSSAPITSFLQLIHPSKKSKR